MRLLSLMITKMFFLPSLGPAGGYQQGPGAGVPGYQGAPGYQQGAQGYQQPGHQGMPGYQGMPGQQGVPGHQGIPGYRAAQGYQSTPGYHAGYPGAPPNPGYPGGPAMRPPPPGADPTLWNWFITVDRDQSNHITANELKQALINGNWTQFNDETCRLMISRLSI